MTVQRERLSPLHLRRRLGEVLDRVELRHEEFIVERKGHELAALIPVPKLERMEALLSGVAGAALEARRGAGLDQREADQLGVAASRAVAARGHT